MTRLHEVVNYQTDPDTGRYYDAWFERDPQILIFPCPGKNETYQCQNFNYTWTDGSSDRVTGIPPPFAFTYTCPTSEPECNYWSDEDQVSILTNRHTKTTDTRESAK